VEGQEGYDDTTPNDASDLGSDYSTVEPEPAPAAPTQSETIVPGDTYSEGKYMVIAGTFRQMANADRMVSRLRKMGYNETRISKFDRGKYAVALVNRFSSLNSARQLERDLESKGIDAEVITE
jgi:cell division septation protein DedD